MALSLRDRKVQLWILGGLAAVVLAAVLFMTFNGGGGSTTTTTTTNPPENPVPLPSPSVSPTPEVIPLFSGRDPFQDLFQPSPGGGTTTPTSNPTNSGSTAPPTGGNGGSNPPSGGGGNTNPGGNSGSGTNIGGHSVLLDDIFVSDGGVRKAQVEVDGTVYTVAAGQSFDGNFRLVSFPSADCAHFVFGDEGFTLCTSGGK